MDVDALEAGVNSRIPGSCQFASLCRVGVQDKERRHGVVFDEIIAVAESRGLTARLVGVPVSQPGF